MEPLVPQREPDLCQITPKLLSHYTSIYILELCFSVLTETSLSNVLYPLFSFLWSL